MLLVCALILIASAAPCIPGENSTQGKLSMRATAARVDGAPPWAKGCSWTWTADQAVDFCITATFTIKINHVTGTITDELMETTVYNHTPVFRVEGSYQESLKGYIIVDPLPPQSVTIPIVGNTTVYYRIPDLAPVRQVGHFNINLGGFGSANFDSITDFSPPLEEYRFPLDLGKSWAAASNLTVWNKMTGSTGAYETTTYQSMACNISTKGAMEDVNVPAGKFPSYNITLDGTVVSGGNSQPFASSLLYSPSVTNLPLRREEPLAGMTVIFGLSSYSLNHAPSVAEPVKNITFPEDTVGSLDLGTVFSDPDAGDQLSYTADNMSNISVKVEEAGRVLFTPQKDWSGPENIGFCATDRKGASSRAVVRVTVTPVNDAPFLVRALPDIIMDEDTVNSSLNLSEHFGDADFPYGDRLGFSAAGNGSIATTISPAGVVTLRPQEDWSGLQNITITASDISGANASASLRVVVLNTPDRPVAICATHDLSMPEDTVLSVELSHRFRDADIPYGDFLTFSAEGLPPDFGMELDERTGSMNITPPADFNGRADMSVTATDRTGLNATEQVRLTVVPVNDPPRLLAKVPAADKKTLAENTSADFTVVADDIDTRQLTISWLLDGSLVGQGGNFTYSADFSSAGNHSLEAVVSDGELNISARWNLSVTNVDRPPADVRILSPANGTRLAFNAAVNLSAEGSDPDGDTLTFTWKDTDGKILGAGRSVMLKSLKSGKHTISLEVSDGTLTVSDAVVVTAAAAPAASRTPMLEPLWLLACITLVVAASRARRQRKD
jgi:hypothetical protein